MWVPKLTRSTLLAWMSKGSHAGKPFKVWGACRLPGGTGPKDVFLPMRVEGHLLMQKKHFGAVAGHRARRLS